jgi:tetratricopeptide (TPR) repeat protein
MSTPDKNKNTPDLENPPLKDIRILFEEKKYDECLIECEKILAINHSVTLAHFFLGVIFESQKEHKKAIEHYSRVAEDCPNLANIYGMVGLAQFEIGDYKGARDSFVKYLEHDDGNTRVWSIVAGLENVLSGRRNAMQILNEAEARITENQDLIYRARGAILRKTDPDSALLYFLQAQNETKDEKQKAKYGEDIYALIVKHIDPLRRSSVGAKNNIERKTIREEK